MDSKLKNDNEKINLSSLISPQKQKKNLVINKNKKLIYSRNKNNSTINSIFLFDNFKNKE